MVALALGLISVAVLQIGSKRRAIILVFTAILAVSIWIFSSDGGNGRLAILATYVELFFRDPILGWSNSVLQPTWNLSNGHNFLLDILGKYGLLGGLPVAIAILIFCLVLKSRFSQLPKAVVPLAVVLSVGFLTGGYTDLRFFGLEQIPILLLLMMLERKPRETALLSPGNK